MLKASLLQILLYKVLEFSYFVSCLRTSWPSCARGPADFTTKCLSWRHSSSNHAALCSSYPSWRSPLTKDRDLQAYF